MTWTTPSNVSTGVASSSQFNTETVANLQHLYDLLHVWSDYVPTWTNLTVGNGSLVARYKQGGDSVDVFVKLVFGSTTSISGTVKCSLPVNAAQTLVTGPARLNDDSAPRPYIGIAVADTASTVIFNQAESGFSMAAATPFTWTTGDALSFTLRYEAA